MALLGRFSCVVSCFISDSHTIQFNKHLSSASIWQGLWAATDLRNSDLFPSLLLDQHSAVLALSAVFFVASLMTQTIKNLPAMQETCVCSLGQEGPLEKGMATHSSTLAWRIPRTEEPGGLQSVGSHKRWTRLSNEHFHFFHCVFRQDD